MFAARRECLSLLAQVLPLTRLEEVESRLLALDDSDTFEALFCAAAAYAKAKNATYRYPETHPREKKGDLALEGAVFVPDYAQLVALRTAAAPACAGVTIPGSGSTV